MKILHESDMVQVFKAGKGGSIYRATKNIENFSVIQDVLNRLTQ